MKSFLQLFIFLFFIQKVSAAPSVTDNHIKVDQFGYQCNAQKIAVISNPITGYNNGSPFTPGTTTYQVRRWNDDAVVFSGTITQWNSGATHTQSGDQVWWFDFTAYTTPGSFYIYDNIRNVGSYRFEIRDDVYKEVLKHAVRSFYYQRCGVAKASPYAATGWTDAACHIGTNQDLNCRLYSDASNPATEKNLSGGWHDAGDYNKYVNFTWGTLIDLLLAYEENPSVWTDDYNIPESGNGIPDLLDEIKFELDWLLKMQQADGSVLSIVGGGAGTPPSASTQARRYGPANTSSALTCAGIFALAAIQYNSAGMTAYASTLQTAAVNAWNWANANPNVVWNNSGLVGAGEQELNNNGRWARKLGASVFLFALTGNATYRNYFDTNYGTHPGGGYWYTWWYAYPFEADMQDVMLYYTKLPGATAAVATNIRNRYSQSLSTGNTDNLPAYTNNTDAYRAFLNDNNYTWGSNRTKAHQGLMFMNMLTYNLDAGNAANYRRAASGFIHYIHGVNPTAFCYLSNMGAAGAENSINEFYHSWFYDGSALWDRVGTSTYGPAPGFLTGGPNRYYNRDGCCPSGCGSAAANSLCNTALITPPLSQPYQKAYKDWNTGWPQNSWEVTENGIYYQAAYIKLLSKFTAGSCGTLPVKFLTFTATLENVNKTILRWQTTDEVNNDFFAIEKSIDGINFTEITQVEPGTNTSVNSYQYIDNNLIKGKAYYRIRQVDLDGSFIYSEIKSVEILHEDLFIIYPNPFSNSVTILSTSYFEDPVEIIITEASGKKVFHSEMILTNEHEISLTNLSQGIYFIYLKGKEGVQIEKLMKE
jgi:hypothetical protein